MGRSNMILVALWAMAIVAWACTNPHAEEMAAGNTPSVSSKGASAMVFQPVVAGRFYTGNPTDLALEIDSYINNADPPELNQEIMGLIAPHAGYMYSGPVAGYAYRAVKGKAYDVVVVIGLSHQVPGTVSVLDYDRYKTPLGEIPIDRDRSKKLIQAASWIDDNEMLFRHEHSLEVQLPFLQQTIPNLKIVMISMRSQSLARCRELAGILDKTFAGTKALFVASSDMSHFHSYDTARKMDLGALDLIDQMNIEVLAKKFESRECEMCGSGPVLTLLELHKLRGGNADGVKVLKYMNSGDTAGSKAEVVGYGAVALLNAVGSTSAKPESGASQESEDYLSADEKKLLLRIARETVEQYVAKGKTPDFEIASETLKKPGAAFVTLHKHGQLRGCIGHILAQMPLWECVREMAIAAATQDPRFSKVTKQEIPELHIEISVLTPPRVCNDPATVVVGKHGLIMSRGFSRGLLLPQVPTEWGWDQETFLSQTCNKAGMERDCWKDKKTKIETFEAIVFSE